MPAQRKWRQEHAWHSLVSQSTLIDEVHITDMLERGG